MKKILMILLISFTLSSVLCSCSSSHEDWHNKQVEKGMREAKKIYGK